ncbi:endonuclease/exonuclease/phosphatase family protein [Halocynthiibacter namhaensis]|uniref:endonuclease/exonuclease/phosphatase family protein n=1 Tax=Halocynthiibacter namhaensis TaxID=1290553 RepID=UPI0005798B20|nr:endonuclease/exonuclease/phosphatase family protein [Halocynthiibacter namhaensis]
MRKLSKFCLIVLIILFLFSFAGMLHPLGDSLAVFRWHLAGAIVVVCLIAAPKQGQERWVWAAVALPAFAAFAQITWQGSWITGTSDFDYQIYQKNMSFRMGDTRSLQEDILATGADFVTLQEVDQDNRQLLKGLSETHPTQAFCDFARVGGVAVATHFPRTELPVVCDAGSGMVAMQVQTHYGTLWLASIHLHWPYPYGQAGQVDRLLPGLESLDGAVLIAGDFNMVPWSHTLRQIAQATTSRRAGNVLYTFPMKDGLITLPIDHVLVPGHFATESQLRHLLGSDHLGVLARFTMPR